MNKQTKNYIITYKQRTNGMNHYKVIEAYNKKDAVQILRNMYQYEIQVMKVEVK